MNKEQVFLLKNKIEEVRKRLHDLISSGISLTEKEVVSVSKQLDVLLNKYNELFLLNTYKYQKINRLRLEVYFLFSNLDLYSFIDSKENPLFPSS